MKNKKGFTLVELLAVIVILGIILLIAVPKITNTITTAKEASFSSSVKLMVASVEREAAVRGALGNNDMIHCSDIATMSAADYDTCDVYYVDSSYWAITACGKSGGKFEGMCVCNGTRNVAEVVSQCGGMIE